MANTKHKAGVSRTAADSRGMVRVYVDLPKNVAQELAVLAVRRDVPKKTLVAELIMSAVAGK